MPIDVKRVAASALEAALQQHRESERPHHHQAEQPHRLRGAAPFVAGAALMTAARLGTKHLPRLRTIRLLGGGLAKLDEAPNLQNFTDSLRDRFADSGSDDAGEPEDSGGEEREDEQDDGGQGGPLDESEEDELDLEESETQLSDEDDDGSTPDLIAALSTENSRPPVIEHLAEGLDPAARPPDAVQRRGNQRRPRARDDSRSGSRRKTRSTAR